MTKKTPKKKRHWYSRKPKRKGHKSHQIAILPTLGILNLGSYALTAGGKLSVLQKGDIQGYLNWVMKDGMMATIGVDPTTKTFDLNRMWAGTFPIVIGALGSKAMTMLGVNRYMSKLPIIGKRVKL